MALVSVYSITAGAWYVKVFWRDFYSPKYRLLSVDVRRCDSDLTCFEDFWNFDFQFDDQKTILKFCILNNNVLGQVKDLAEIACTDAAVQVFNFWVVALVACDGQ